MADYAPRLEQLLREAGCRFVRQGKGDHELWYSPLTNRYFPIGNKIKSRHTANGILKQAGLDKPFWHVIVAPSHATNPSTGNPARRGSPQVTRPARL